MDIITSLCVDDERHPASYYDQLQDASADQRRRIYWQCVTVFFATSTRCNPAAHHVLYTNDRGSTTWNGVDFQQFLRGLGVEIRQMPFDNFQPPAGFSERFRNGFYKLEVMQQLARPEAADYSLLLDSDCVWTRPEPALEATLRSGQLLLFDISGDPDTEVLGMSRRHIGNLYRELFPDYPTDVPVYFGGELVGGSRACFADIMAKLEPMWQQVVAAHPEQPPRFANGESIFDGDEYMTILAYNCLDRPWTDAHSFIRRIWTAYRYSDVRPTDLQLPIWHLPSEKLQGLPVLSRQVLNPRSRFWQVPLPELGRYMGRYLGVPRSLVHPQRLLSLSTKLSTAWRLTKRLLKT
ncbi:hypothetical protein LJ737_18595 [Hymenobacter sp. 15J16-1T3B]|uniref:hypothetical protein n=1 Tax=Hymenobacter sp. 15J16-1T3B TaxID=2886941 RepID=UPI001D0F5049|nr:hypothetical protein [Hymenobacter sp. 15J16-1T3B]MCC3159258.1 hypothetical protein [Hymenobacter sp. 15J16-1T3B]